MDKYIVCKKVFATELIWVEADSKEEAVNLVSEGDGVPARLDFEWDGDMPPHFWTAHKVEITGEDVQSLQEYTTALAFEE